MPGTNDLETFLTELTELSRKHRIMLDGDTTPFVMEDADMGQAYICTDEGKLARIEA